MVDVVLEVEVVMLGAGSGDALMTLGAKNAPEALGSQVQGPWAIRASNCSIIKID